MKKLLITVFAALFFLTNVSFGQPGKENEKYIKLYIEQAKMNLESEYQSIVESSIYTVIAFTKKYPNENYSEIVEKLNKLAFESDNTVVSSKAYAASLMIKNQADFNIDIIKYKKNPDAFFKILFDSLKTKLVAEANYVNE